MTTYCRFVAADVYMIFRSFQLHLQCPAIYLFRNTRVIITFQYLMASVAYNVGLGLRIRDHMAKPDIFLCLRSIMGFKVDPH